MQRYDFTFFGLTKIRYCLMPFLHLREITSSSIPRIMENIQNTRGKGYFMLYLGMILFFIIGLILMLYSRSSVLEFPVQ